MYVYKDGLIIREREADRQMDGRVGAVGGRMDG